MASILPAILALLQLAPQLISLFVKSPEDKLQAISKKLLEYIEDIQVAVKKAKETKGDTSALEDILNRRR